MHVDASGASNAVNVRALAHDYACHQRAAETCAIVRVDVDLEFEAAQWAIGPVEDFGTLDSVAKLLRFSPKDQDGRSIPSSQCRRVQRA